MMKCVECGSYAINHHCHGRDGSDPTLCDVCYWRKRATPQTEIFKVLQDLTAALRDRHHGRMPDEVKGPYERAWAMVFGTALSARPKIKLRSPDMWRDGKNIRGYTKDPGPGPWYDGVTVRQILINAGLEVEE